MSEYDQGAIQRNVQETIAAIRSPDRVFSLVSQIDVKVPVDEADRSEVGVKDLVKIIANQIVEITLPAEFIRTELYG